jgi:hypothetical protein
LTARKRGGRFLGSPYVPSPVSGIRTPKLPLLPLWEKGAGGMRGQKRTGMQKTARKGRVSGDEGAKARGNADNCTFLPRTLPLREGGRGDKGQKHRNTEKYNRMRHLDAPRSSTPAISITRPSADVTPGKMDLDGNKIPGGVPGIPFTVKYCCWLPDQDSNLEPTD